MSQRGFTGGPMAAMRADGKKVKNLRATLNSLLHFLKPHSMGLILSIFLSISATLCSLFIPRLLGMVTSDLVDYTISLKNSALANINTLLLSMAVLYVLSTGLSYLQAFLMAKITQDLTFELRKEISIKINHIPLKTFDSQSIGDILSRVTNDIDVIGQSLQQAITQIITAFTTLTGIILIMLSMSVQLSTVAIISLPITLTFITRIVKLGQKYFRNRAITLGKLNAHVEETLGAHAIIKAFNAENTRIEQFERLSNQLKVESLKSEFIGGTMMPILNFLSNLSFIIISAYGAYLVLLGQLRVGDVQAFIQYNRAFMQPINQIGNIGTLFQQTMASAERVFEFLNEAEERVESTSSCDPKAFVGRVEFKKVTFGYDASNPFIQDLSFSVKPGKRIAIVGPTGAGKTTLINLLLRFYEPLSGSIEIDGINIQSLSRAQLRSILGMVLQDTWLFNGTLEENIRFNHPDANPQRFLEATQKARVEAFVQSLTDGYEFKLNEEATNLSTGQKQLLTIARSFMTSPVIQILDEATSSVDTRTEVLIQHAMEELMVHKTSFIIAHRLSTIKDADLILVLNKGSIVEQGSHIELMTQKGFYYQLYASQFEPES